MNTWSKTKILVKLSFLLIHSNEILAALHTCSPAKGIPPRFEGVVLRVIFMIDFTYSCFKME
jgi:hypothetical protein